MTPATLSSIKKELKTLHESELAELCLRLARFKKDNKELLTYLLFEAENEQGYIDLIKEEMEVQMEEVNTQRIYLCKKGLRKILRYLNKVIRYSGIKQTEVELRLFYLRQVKERRFPISRSTVLENLFNGQVKRVETAIEKLHEDLQFDYSQELKELI